MDHVGKYPAYCFDVPGDGGDGVGGDGVGGDGLGGDGLGGDGLGGVPPQSTNSG